MVRDLRQAFSLENLKRAWKWTTTNPEAYYKNYFRHIYRAYSISVEENLKDLHSRLVKNIYQPTDAIKIYLPKKSGLQRIYTLLAVEDQIVYQALVNIIAERLAPVVRPRYLKEVFGHLYTSIHNSFFYRDWRECHQKFGSTIRRVYKQGFIFTASFDLTACYDSIDHSVLSHFLQDLGLQKEFIGYLCDNLKHWTANIGEEQIYQGHGIPQGPLPSGLLSEVVLRYFDENRSTKPRAWRYFRYVDDIRFFAKNEQDLRSILIEMDMLSKRIGLFPQNSKIDIHKVINIEDEIKSIVYPPEVVVNKKSPDQKKVQKRLLELSPRFEVTNETRFKYVLGSALPSSRLNYRLLKILEKQPHLYYSIFNYFKGLHQFSEKLSKEILKVLQNNALYPAFTAYGLKALEGRCLPNAGLLLEQYARETLDKDNLDIELRTSSTSILMKRGALPWHDIESSFGNHQFGW